MDLKMINSKNILAIVPARKGSKGLPNKNIKLINNIPLIGYPIIAAKNSKYIDKVLFTSDSKKYCKIAKKYGAEVPFLRPSELSTDTSLRSDVIIHAINYMESNSGIKFDILIYLEPTSPLTNESDIDR